MKPFEFLKRRTQSTTDCLILLRRSEMLSLSIFLLGLSQEDSALRKTLLPKINPRWKGLDIRLLGLDATLLLYQKNAIILYHQKEISIITHV